MIPKMIKSFRMLRLSVLCSWLLSLTACGPTQTSNEPIGYVPPKPKDNLPLVDHPEYVHWSQFPVDSYVVRKKTVTNENGSVYVTTKVRLAEKTEKQVVVEQQVTVVRPEGTRVNEPQYLRFPAHFRLPEDVDYESYLTPSRKAKKTGTEKINLAGHDFETDIYEWEEVNEAGPMTVKLWRSESVPGRMLREESLIKRDGDTGLEELVELNLLNGPKTGA